MRLQTYHDILPFIRSLGERIGSNLIDAVLNELFGRHSLTHSVLILFYWQATGALSLIPSFTLSYLYKTPVYVPILSVNWVYQLTWYKLGPMKQSNTGNVQKMDDIMYLNARRLQSALGIQSMFFPTTIVVASIEWVKG